MPNATQITVNGTNYNVKDAGVREMLNVFPGMKTITPSDFQGKLAKVNVSCIISVLSSDWDDLPDSITAGTFFNCVYDTMHASQVIISYPARKMFARTVQYTNGTVLQPWVEYAQTNDLSSFLKILSVAPSGYDNKVGKVSTPGIFNVISTDGWTDLPASSFTGVVANFVYDQAAGLQIAYQYKANQYYSFMRFVNPSTGAPYLQDWKQIDGYDLARIETPDATAYSGSLARISHNMVCAFSSGTGWDDYPPGMTACYLTVQYFGYAYIQTVVSYPDGNGYRRICANNSALTPWIPLSGGQNETVYYAIGDSITSGSYSQNDGSAVVATNAEWSYPNRIKRRYGCKVKNLGVPGASITEFSAQVSQIQSDATLVTITGGANDYNGSVPLGTHTSAVGTSTICGAIKSVVETVASRAPNARIVLVSPLIIKTGSASTKWSLNQAGSAGFTYAQLADAMADIAEDYNIEFIDGTRTGPTNVLNIGDVQKDNVHPTKDFYNTIANWLGGKLF